MNERRAEHDRLKTIMARFAAMMDAPGGPDHTGLLRERMLFAQVFNGHLAHEQEDVAGLDATPDLAAKARMRVGLLTQLRRDYSDHVRYWTPASIASDWAAYRGAVLALQRRLTTLMTWEEGNLPIYA